MPDWLTYVLSAWIFCEIAYLIGIRNARRYVAVAAVGAVLPDLVKPFFLLKTCTGLDLIAFSVPFATPVGAILVAGLVSQFFKKTEIRRVFVFMLAGVVLHLLWDSTLHPYGGGQLIFFPFNFNQYSLGLIWSDSILPLVIIGIPAAVLYVLRFWYRSQFGTKRGKGL